MNRDLAKYLGDRTCLVRVQRELIEAAAARNGRSG